MTITLTDLAKPISWRDRRFWPMLEDLQGNILKGHGRDHTVNHMLAFDEARKEDIREQLRALGARVTSALTQLNQVQAFKRFGRVGGTAVFFALSATGYAKLGETPPAGAAFAAGMAAAQHDLADRPAIEWEPHLRPGVDALLIVADDDPAIVANAAETLLAPLRANGVRLLGRDIGQALRGEKTRDEPKGRGLEHFGYVDGRSQPLMLQEDLVAEEQSDGVAAWNPSFGPADIALVPDPNGASQESFGSFLVYRKLEQDVRAFKQREQDLADHLGLKGNDRERAGAMVVGRFEDGTPLVHSRASCGASPAINDFNYDTDETAVRCPLHAHVRKVNPRQERFRANLMPRRGITYGTRVGALDDPATRPSEGVGLLFMAYNKSIERQFVVTQQHWANDASFPDDKAHGQDPVIGQPGTQPQRWHPDYGASSPAKSFDFKSHVTLQGGEYFFAPSRSFLMGL